MGKTAVYPGSFDPITNGHLDLLDRGLKIFDRIIIAVTANPAGKTLFTLEERVQLIKLSVEDHPQRHRLEVDSCHGLLVDYVSQLNLNVVMRGLRANSDFEYEFQMALMNRKLSNDVETIYLMTGMRWIYINSRIIKEVAMSGGCITGLVPEPVEKILVERHAAAAQDLSGGRM